MVAIGTAALACAVALAGPTPGLTTFSNPLDITNPYQPFEPGATKVFTGQKDGAPQILFDHFLTTTRRFTLPGKKSVKCRLLEETAIEDGVLVEISHNYFAQGDDGAVYYFGEVVDIYEDDLIVSHEGSWLVGGATAPDDPPGIGNAAVPALFMPAHPVLGSIFKPENLFPAPDSCCHRPT